MLRIGPARPLSFERAIASRTRSPKTVRLLDSVKNASAFHREALNAGRNVKSFTAVDGRTRELALDILARHPQADALRRIVMASPSTPTDALGSVKLVLARMEDHPAHWPTYLQRHGETALVTCGGIAARVTSVLAGITPGVARSLSANVHIVRDHGESNAAHSASQTHVRHGTALNADPGLTGHRLAWHFLRRQLIGISEAEMLAPDFRKIDLDLRNMTRQQAVLYVRNELNWLRQELRERLGLLTEHDLNRLESTVSQDVLHFIEQATGEVMSSTAHGDPADSISIHVDLSAEAHRATLHENERLASRSGIVSTALSPEERVAMFGTQAPLIHGATRYHGDGHLHFDAHATDRRILERHGGTWIDGEVTHALFAEHPAGRARFAGVLLKDGSYHYASHGHFSLGYLASYQFAASSGSALLHASAIPGYQLTTATGLSMNAILDLRACPGIRTVADERGTLPQFAVTNSHWTMIARQGDLALVRITGGGTTGEETCNPAYFFNLLENTGRIFGPDALAGIVSTRGCPRSINARNSTEFFKSAGLLVSYGKGGTGITKGHAEAALALATLDPRFKAATCDHLDAFTSRTGQPLGKAIDDVHRKAVDLGFVREDPRHFDRVLGRP